MDHEEAIIKLGKLLLTLQAKLEVTQSVLAEVIQVLPDASTAHAEWSALIARATADVELGQVSGIDLPNEYMRESHDHQVQLWHKIFERATSDQP